MSSSSWRRGVLVVLLAAAPLVGAVAPATAQPAPAQPAAPTDQAGALGRLAEIDRSTVELEGRLAAAEQALAARRAEVADATAERDRARQAAEAEAGRAEVLRSQVDGLVVALHGGARTNRLSGMLTADGPQDLLDRMTALDLLGADSAARLTAAATAQEVAQLVLAGAEASRTAAEAAQVDAQAVQDDLVARRAALQSQSDEANALLATLGNTPAASASRSAQALRASRALGRSALVAQPTVGTYTSGFGPRGGAAHNGIDIANAVGTPIVAVADGVVVDAGPAQGFGQWVRVRHDDGTISTYGHVESLETSVGARVSAGQLIATMGNRGQSTGPHLHLEIETPGGGKVDPRAWLAERGVSV
ncbi:hypothetical protein GCM10027047_04510 [Rhodococcus aerolatus]